MKEIPGENHQSEFNREDRRQGESERSGEITMRDTPPCCCHCRRELQPGVRYSWTKDARMQCAACSGPGDTILTFT